MKIFQAIRLRLEYHKLHSPKNTIRVYGKILTKFCNDINDKDLNEPTWEEILALAKSGWSS